MRRLIFLNIGIDALWAKNHALDLLFPARNPHNSRLLKANQHLGLYLSRETDSIIVPWELEPEFVDWLSEKGVGIGARICIDEEVGKEKWLEALRVLDSREQFDGAVFAGSSSAEEAVCRHLKIQNPSPSEAQSQLYADVNKKNFLYEICQKRAIAFPETRVVDPADTKCWDHGDISYPAFLKASYGSGGGGVFELSNADDRMLTHIEKLFRRFHIKEEWLLQRRYEKAIDFSVCCEVDSSGTRLVHAFQVSYNKKRSSWRHRSFDWRNDPRFHTLEVSLKCIGEELFSLGFHGPFAVDGFLTKAGELFPAVDLNARYDKCRLLFESARRFGITSASYESRSVRFLAKKPARFGEWIKQVRADLRGVEVWPYDAPRCFHGPTQMNGPVPKELGFFLKSTPESAEIGRRIGQITAALFGGEAMAEEAL